MPDGAVVPLRCHSKLRCACFPNCGVPVCRPGSDMQVVHKAYSLEAVPELIPELEALTSSLQATDVSECVWVLGIAMQAHGTAGSRQPG